MAQTMPDASFGPVVWARFLINVIILCFSSSYRSFSSCHRPVAVVIVLFPSSCQCGRNFEAER